MNGRCQNVSTVPSCSYLMMFLLICGLLLLLLPWWVSADLVLPRPGNYRSKHKPRTVVGKYANYTWPNRELASKIDGEIVIGALHMIHERSEDLICGAIMPDGGIQALEVMLYTLDQINNDPDFLPGITLGVLAKDDCDRDIYGLEQAVDFIRGRCFFYCILYSAIIIRIKEKGISSAVFFHLFCTYFLFYCWTHYRFMKFSETIFLYISTM